jgi:sec-independent protein translocase protein TatA
MPTDDAHSSTESHRQLVVSWSDRGALVTRARRSDHKGTGVVDMGSFSLMHWIVVLAIILILFGAGKLPRVMGDFAKGIKAFKAGMREEDEADAPPAAPAQVAPPSAAATAAAPADAGERPRQPV